MTPVYPKVIVRFLSAYKSGIKFKKNLYPKVVNNMVPFNAESTKIQSPIHHPLNTVNPRASKDIISMCHICCSLFFHPRTVILSNTKCNYVARSPGGGRGRREQSRRRFDPRGHRGSTGERPYRFFFLSGRPASNRGPNLGAE
jgi:hypothetical protein